MSGFKVQSSVTVKNPGHLQTAWTQTHHTCEQSEQLEPWADRLWKSWNDRALPSRAQRGFPGVIAQVRQAEALDAEEVSRGCPPGLQGPGAHGLLLVSGPS